jgi:hypothetical protein
MRVLGRIGSALAVLALAAPSAALAQQPPGMASTMPNLAPTPAPTMVAAPAPHRHKWSLFGRNRHCVECQRAEAYRRHGVQVPPPPAMPGAEMTHAGTCADCGKPLMAMKSLGHGSTLVHADAAPAPPGIASIGEPAPGTGPEAIGVYSAGVPAAAPMPNGMKNPRDEAIQQSSMTTSTPVPGHIHNRPHIIRHVLNLDEIGKERRERPDKKKTAHASISYGPAAAPVNELPAKMVYGK